MDKRPFIGCGLVFLLIVAFAIAGVRIYFRPHPKTERSEVVQRGVVQIEVVETGAIQPVRKVDVKSKVSGRVSHLLVHEGDLVRTGQVLATIDPQDVNTQVAALQAQLASARAHLAEARQNAVYQKAQTTASISQYEHNVEAARAHLLELQSDAEAQPKLSRQAIDIARANLDAAENTLKAQQDAVHLLVDTTDPEAVVSAQAAYDEAKAQAVNDALNLQRQQQLVKKGFIAEQQSDTAATTLSISEARARDAKEKLDRVQLSNQIQEENARAQVASAQANVRQMEAALAQAETSVLPVTVRRQLQNARAAYDQSLAQLDAARSGRSQDQMRADEVTAAAADMRQIQNQLDEKLVNLHDTTLVSPLDGMVTHRYVEEGELITSALETFSSGSPVYEVSDLSTMLVKINVNEVDIAKLRVGMPTEVTIDGAPGVTFEGRVRKISPEAVTAAAGSTDSGTAVIRFAVEIQLLQSDPRLRPGMSARCAIIVARRKNALRLPATCIRGSGSVGTVEIVTSQQKGKETVEITTPRKVTVGLRGDDFVEILSGVSAGERVRPNPYNGPPRKTIDIQGPG